ncbi:MAG: 5'-nucleotidase C-terminal domain-containing protein [Bacillota bacterium]|nr:5'-nucleotidase C-terminal domain-containing protein [Bacillota bacterium]
MKNAQKTAVLSITVILAVLTILIILIAGSGTDWQVVYAAETQKNTTDTKTVSVVFTHDMHSHMDADKKEKNGRITESGGFARLKTVIDTIKKEQPDSFVLDAGDFSMGTPYQTIFSKEASELKMMEFIGIEATTLGNHEFDYRAEGLASMLESADKQGPRLVAANIDWEKTLADDELGNSAKRLKDACDNYGVKEYEIIEHNGIKAAVFGLLGKNAADYAPESGLYFKDPVGTAAELTKRIEAEADPDIIICLSHCGTIENEKDVLEETEDYILAEEVPEIDLIISGHSHTKLEEPVVVGNTVIASCGSYNDSAGHVVMKPTAGHYELESYEMIALDESIVKDEKVEAELSEYRNLLDEEYFDNYGYSAGQTIAWNDIDFPDIEYLGLIQQEEPLGSLIADSYKYAVAKADAGGVQITVVPLGVIRGSLLRDEITVGDAFNVLSLGYGKDGLAGYPLVKAYLTGRELKAVAEVDASVSGFMGVARLYCSGLEYSWNDSRLIMNRAVDVKYNDGETIIPIEDDKLYSVVTDLYSCQMLGSVKEQSFGLLKIEPKDKDGNPIEDYEEHIIYDGDRELKAWYALASYIDSFEGNQIPEYYSQVQGRKTEIDSISPAELLKQPNNVFWIALAAVIGIIAIIACAAVMIRRFRRKKLEKEDE